MHDADDEYARDVLDAVLDALFVCDLAGHTVAVNSTMCDLFACSKSTALSTDFSDWSAGEAPYTADGARAMFARVPTHGTQVFEWRNRTANGALFWSEITIRIVRLAGHDRLLVTIRDTSAAKQQAVTLRESEDRFHLIFNASSNAVAFTDAEHGRIVDVNDTWVRESGVSRADAIGRTARDLGLWRDLTAREDVLNRLQRDGRVREYETTLNMRGDRDYALNADLVDTRAGRCILWEFRDLTDARRAAREQDALRAQLNQAQKLETVGRLAGGVAHDFNNLLTVILSLAKLMGESPRNAEDAEDLQQIIRAGERAAQLTRQLLAFARRQIVEPKVLDVNTLVTNFDGMLRRVIGEDIRLVIACDPGVGAIRGDQSQLDQVLMNLAVNARDAMEHGGTLTIETSNVLLDSEAVAKHPEVLPGEYVMLSVTDTGSGIDPRALEHIFEPFFTTKPTLKGTGLGLSTCYGIVRQHGGVIWVYSELGRGTVFKICLPRVAELETKRDDVRRDVPARGSERILLAEDDDALRRLAMRVLSQHGYVVDDARDGLQAISRFMELNGRVDLLITDVVMPHMSGKDLATELRKRNPQLKVLYTSGYTENTIVHHGVVDAGVNFLAKPYVPSDLARRVREVLDLPFHAMDSEP